ncbi:hypothetical protein GCM10008018_45690 [Paenibacillus marchantiophytorum]|uniref:Schlafen AlbA-2 domain-containing protein n=1 Tax=Paenibacillus marchantiophytorum TaxID=1619310 RepID=A0ABQ1EZ31_9BACL|nr:ATP-binding protein [Paenibacillus marchantiophytorum]GFZ94120.1 hypothetical protein GCM10008018_45690 [Paenibacillus marchantiophytorum]
MNMNDLDDLILYGYECEYLDFKEKQYSKEKHVDLLADVMAMANSRHVGDKYIIVGIKDRPEGKEIKGINPEEFIDSSVYTQVILSNIEPDIQMDYFKYDFNGKALGVIRIFNTDKKPYMIKRKNERFNEGSCLIRKGSLNANAKRSDFDYMYRHHGEIEIRLLEDTLLAVHDREGCASIEVLITNNTEYPLTFVAGMLIVSNDKGIELSQHPVYGINEIAGADFRLGLQPKTEVIGRLFVGFSSADPLRLDMDEHGICEQPLVCHLAFKDGRDNIYHTEVAGRVIADGDFLWKVKSKKGIKHKFRTH